MKPKRRLNIIQIGPGSIVTMSDREYVVDRNGARRRLAKQKEEEKPSDPTRHSGVRNDSP